MCHSDGFNSATNSAGDTTFVNHNPTSFFNLLDVLKKYCYEVDSLISPISSCEVIKANHQFYKNCEIHLVDLEISLIPLDFSINNPVSVSLIYPVSHLEERYINSSVFVGLRL